MRRHGYAIFGTLTEIPLLELLRTLGKRTGKLSIKVLPIKCDYDLYLDKSRLRALCVNGQVVRSGVSIREAFVELSNAKDGQYIFRSISEEELPKSFDVPLKPLLLNTTNKGEVNHYKERLPARQTRFKLARRGELEAWQSESLKTFWERTALLFNRGSSAEEIARELNLEVTKVQLNIYKLRSLGQIAPIRSFENKLPPSSPRRVNSLKATLPGENLEKSLIKNINHLSYEEILKSLKGPQKGSLSKPKDETTHTHSSSSSSSNYSVNKGLINHLLRALKRG